jgi:hypothetical protein
MLPILRDKTAKDGAPGHGGSQKADSFVRKRDGLRGAVDLYQIEEEFVDAEVGA